MGLLLWEYLLDRSIVRRLSFKGRLVQRVDQLVDEGIDVFPLVLLLLVLGEADALGQDL